MLRDPLAVHIPMTGPRGGNLENVNLHHQEAKRAPLNVVDLGAGISSLHKQEGFKEIACQGVKDAQPWHMMAVAMMVNGMALTDIARAAGVTASYLSTLKSQRWFQELLAIEAAKLGKGITNLIQGEVLASIETILEIRDDPNQAARTRLQAANIILEQGQGKPIQKTVNFTATTSFSSLEEEEKALKEELKAIRATVPTKLLDFPEAPTRSGGETEQSLEDARREASQKQSS